MLPPDRASRIRSRRKRPPPPVPAGVVILEGQITNAVGAGHEDIKITVRHKTDDGSDGELIATTTTDEYGDFAVHTEQALRAKVVVTLTADNYKPLVLEFDLDPEQPAPFIGQDLEGAISIRGQVLDALNDKPIAGADVKLQANYQDWEAQTDESGVFLLDGLVPSKGLLIVEAEGFGRERKVVEVSVDEPDNAQDESQGESQGQETEKPQREKQTELPPVSCTVKLKPERTLHLKLVDNAGKSIAGVTIEAYDEPRDDFRLLVSDENGTAELRGLHFDATLLGLRLTHTDYVSSQGFDRSLSLPADQAESSETLVLNRAGRITGKVTDRATGRPVNGARLVVGIEYSDDTPRAWADFEGNYLIEGVPPGENVVTIHASDHAPELIQVEVKAGEAATLEVQLAADGTLLGKVVDADGNPVPNPFVATGLWRGHETLGLRAVGNEQGEFTLIGCPADEFEIMVRAGGRAPQSQLVQVGRDNPVVVKLTAPVVAPGSAGVSKLKVGTPAPDFEVITLDSKTLKLSELKGKVVLLQFWATWCPPCMEELPHVRAVAEQFGPRTDFILLGISLDYDEPSLRQALTKHKVTWAQVFGEAGGAYKLATAYGVEAIPALILIDAEGKLLQTDLRGKQITEAVSKALSEDLSE